MADNLYYIGDADKSLITLNEYCHINVNEGKFWDYLKNLIDDDDVNDYFADEVDRYNEADRNIIGYVMPENWKHQLIDKYATEISVDDIEKYIGELGIRKAFRIADDCGFYEEDNYKDALTSNAGLRRLFYAILWLFIDINDKYNFDIDELYVNEYDLEGYNAVMYPDDLVPEIEPITDHDLDKIGKAVAKAA